MATGAERACEPDCGGLRKSAAGVCGLEEELLDYTVLISQYNRLNFCINVGQYDLYFEGQRVCLMSLRLFYGQILFFIITE